MNRYLKLLVTGTFALFLLACSKSEPTGPSNGDSDNGSPVTGKGNLQLTITAQVPFRNFKPTIIVTGPGGSFKPDSSQTLNDLKTGLYTIVAFRKDLNPFGGELVGKAYGETEPVKQIEVKDSQTTQVTVKYAEQPASNKLWVATGFGSNSSLLAFSSAQLQVPGAPSPAYKISMNSAGFFRGYRGLAFDQMGNLWVADNAKGEILGLSPGQLTGGQVNPAVVIKNNSINSPSGVAFDKKGNLWVSTSTSGDGTLIAYRAETLQRFLAQKGIFSDPPDITIATVKLVNFFTFDANENLWITSDTPPSASLYDDILKFNAQSLNAPGQPSPAIILTGGKQIDFQDTFLDNPAEALAFDKNGNLWGALGNRLFKLAANQLASSGQPKPALWVNLPGSGGSLTKGLVFDALGQIWVTDKDDVSRLIKFVPPNTDNPSIIDGGTVFITSNDIDDPQGLAFYPPPPGYPIY